MTDCSIPGCKIFVSPNQEKTTKGLYGKPYCKDHEVQANIDAKKETEALMTPRAKVRALLARKGFIEQSVPGFYLLDDGSTKIAVDLNHQVAFPGVPVIGTLQVNGDIQEEGHGINRIDDLRREIEGILKSKGAGNSKKSPPAPVEKNKEVPQQSEKTEQYHEEEHKKAEAGKATKVKEYDTGSEKPEVIIPGNVLAILEKYGWAVNGDVATKFINDHSATIDLSKLNQGGKAVEVAGYMYQHGQNNVIDAELKSLFGEIANPKKQERKPAEKPSAPTPPAPDAHETALARIRDVELTPETIIKYLCPDASFEEAVLFLQVCKHRNLNPFIPGEVFLIKYDKMQPAATVVGKYAFTKKADAHPDFRGYHAGIIVLSTEGKIEEREGTFYLPRGKNTREGDVFETLLGGWARVKRQNREDTISKVALHECVRYKKDGQLTRAWQEQPATQISKTAVVRALRDAFPAELGGIYVDGEVVEVN